MEAEGSEPNGPRICQVNLAQKFGGDELYQVHCCTLYCLDLLAIYLLVHPKSLGQPDEGCLQDVVRLPDMLDEYGLAGRLYLIPVELEFVLAGSGTTVACGMEEHSAHSLALKLVKNQVSSLRQARDDSVRTKIIWSLDRQELLGLRAKLVREWYVAAYARQHRGGHRLTLDVLVQFSDDLLGQSQPRKPADTPTTAEAKAASPGVRRKGGRPRSREDLWELIQRMKIENPAVTDEDIAADYNRRYGRSIKENRRSKADVTAVKNVRYDRTKRSRKQDHD